MKTIYLSQGQFATVSDEDYEEISKYSWSALNIKGRWYAGRSVSRYENGKRIVSKVYMHRQIMGVESGDERIDHKDGNGLNNVRSNLRKATLAENNRNVRKQYGTTSRFKGVCWHLRMSKWVARIHYNGTAYYLGSFDDEREAARVYDDWARQLHGEFARTNEDLGLL